MRSFVFIHIAGSICIFNIFFVDDDFRSALGRGGIGYRGRRGPDLHTILAYHN